MVEHSLLWSGVHGSKPILIRMGIIDLGTVLRLQNDSVAVVIGIITGGMYGTYYTVIEGSVVREINENEIKEVVNEH